jgi:hypothetical protein
MREMLALSPSSSTVSIDGCEGGPGVISGEGPADLAPNSASARDQYT